MPAGVARLRVEEDPDAGQARHPGAEFGGARVHAVQGSGAGARRLQRHVAHARHRARIRLREASAGLRQVEQRVAGPQIPLSHPSDRPEVVPAALGRPLAQLRRELHPERHRDQDGPGGHLDVPGGPHPVRQAPQDRVRAGRHQQGQPGEREERVARRVQRLPLRHGQQQRGRHHGERQRDRGEPARPPADRGGEHGGRGEQEHGVEDGAAVPGGEPQQRLGVLPARPADPRHLEALLPRLVGERQYQQDGGRGGGRPAPPQHGGRARDEEGDGVRDEDEHGELVEPRGHRHERGVPGPRGPRRMPYAVDEHERRRSRARRDDRVRAAFLRVVAGERRGGVQESGPQADAGPGEPDAERGDEAGRRGRTEHGRQPHQVGVRLPAEHEVDQHVVEAVHRVDVAEEMVDLGQGAGGDEYRRGLVAPDRAAVEPPESEAQHHHARQQDRGHGGCSGGKGPGGAAARTVRRDAHAPILSQLIGFVTQPCRHGRVERTAATSNHGRFARTGEVLARVNGGFTGER